MEYQVDDNIWYNEPGVTDFYYIDLFGSGPVTYFDWSSALMRKSGSCGQASLASEEKGKLFFEEAVNNLVEYVNEFQKQPRQSRIEHHLQPPTSPLPDV